MIISPSVLIRGDGRGALAYSEVNASGQIANVNVINVGQQYSEASVLIVANMFMALAQLQTLSFGLLGGHGSDCVRELGSTRFF